MLVDMLSHMGDEAHSIVSDNRHAENCCMCTSKFKSQLRKFSSVRYNGCKYFETTASTEVVTYIKRVQHIHPVLQNLHWLPIKYRMKYKVVTLAYKIQSTGGPAYLLPTVNE
jgi:hypothetical protein